MHPANESEPGLHQVDHYFCDCPKVAEAVTRIHQFYFDHHITPPCHRITYHKATTDLDRALQTMFGINPREVIMYKSKIPPINPNTRIIGLATPDPNNPKHYHLITIVLPASPTPTSELISKSLPQQKRNHKARCT